MIKTVEMNEVPEGAIRCTPWDFRIGGGLPDEAEIRINGYSYVVPCADLIQVVEINRFGWPTFFVGDPDTLVEGAFDD
jgi:hypothetical protein